MRAWSLAQGTLFWQKFSYATHYNKTLNLVQVVRDLFLEERALFKRLLRPIFVLCMFPGQIWQRGQLAQALIEFVANVGRVEFKGTVAEDIEGDAAFQPLG